MDFSKLDNYSIAMLFYYLDIESHWNLRQTSKRINEIGSKSYHKHSMGKQIQNRLLDDMFFSVKNIDIFYSQKTIDMICSSKKNILLCLKLITQTLGMCQYVAFGNREYEDDRSAEDFVLLDLLHNALVENEDYSSDGLLRSYLDNQTPSFDFSKVRNWYSFTAGKGAHNHFYLFSTKENYVWLVQMGWKKKVLVKDWKLSYFEWRISRNSSTEDVEMVEKNASQRSLWKENVCERLTKYVYPDWKDQCIFKITPEILYKMGSKSWKNHGKLSLYDDWDSDMLTKERERSFWEAFGHFVPRQLINQLKYYASLCWGDDFMNMLVDFGSNISEATQVWLDRISRIS